MSNRQNLDWFVNALCDQNNGTMGAEPWVRRTLTRRDNHLLINLWFLSQYLMKFNDIFHKYRTELFWLDVIIFVPLIRTEILHFSGISLGGRTLGTPVYLKWQNWQSSISVCWMPNSYSRILHVKSVQNTEVPYCLAALAEDGDRETVRIMNLKHST